MNKKPLSITEQFKTFGDTANFHFEEIVNRDFREHLK